MATVGRRVLLPDTPSRYDPENEQEMRRLIELEFLHMALSDNTEDEEEAQGSIIQVPFILLWNTDATISDIPLAATEIDAANKRLRRVADLQEMQSARLVANISAAAAGAVFKAQYSIDDGTSWHDLGCELSTATTGQPVVGAYVDIPAAAARATTWLRAITEDGDGAVDVTVSWLEVQFSRSAVTAIETPDQISDLILWFESDDGLFADEGGTTPQTTNGGEVSRWNNKVVGGPNLAGGVGPLLDKTNTVNGIQVIHFDAASLHQLSLPGSAITGLSLTAGEIFVVLKTVADPSGTNTKTGFMKTADADAATHYPYTDGVIYDAFGTTTRKTCGNPTTSLNAWHIYNVYSASGDWALRLNGVVQHSTATNTVDWSNDFWLGRSHFDGFFHYFLDARVAAVLFYGRKLNTAERESVHSYLMDKYNL